MPSSLTLTTLRDRVEAFLIDNSNAIWTTGTLEEAVRLALHAYSKHNPQRAIGTVTLSAASRELALSSLTGLLGVDRVWFPYTASDPEYPPEWITFQVWNNAGAFTLFLDVKEDPAVDDVARVWYRKLQTLNGLDSASATTFPASDDSVLVTGAAGYAAGSELVDKIGQIRPDRREAERMEKWSQARLAQFRTALARLYGGPLPDHGGPRVHL